MSTKGSAESYIELRGSLSIPEMITGKSAYEIAVMHGFKGTEEEWIKSVTADADRAKAAADRAEEASEEVQEILTRLTFAEDVMV